MSRTDERETPAALEPITILLVDDDPEVLWSTERILAGAGFRVVTEGRATAVLDQARLHRPALILLDVVLADGDGVDVARQLKSDPDLAAIFVILLSGARTRAEDQVQGLAEGLADGYIARPVGKPELLARIDVFLRIRASQLALRASEAEVRKLNAELELRIAERTAELQVRESLIAELRETAAKVKVLSGLIPICAKCKKIRDDKGYWGQIEIYIRDHSEAEFSHGICPDCAKVLYPGCFKT
jgi:DNA-binding response OmpR family regulator